MSQDDSICLLLVLPAALHGKSLRAPDRLPQGHQVRRDQGHPGLHVQGRGQCGSGTIARWVKFVI